MGEFLFLEHCCGVGFVVSRSDSRINRTDDGGTGFEKVGVICHCDTNMTI